MPSLPFEPNCPSFSIQNAYYLAKASAAAYAAGEDFKTRAAELGLETSSPDASVDDISYFIGTTPSFVVLAFRGTVFNDIHNWMTNATIDQVPNKVGGGSVHEGFSKALNGGWDKLLATIWPLVTADRTLWVTGHSLGGALATLAAQWLVGSGVKVAGTYTYGSPRVGNSGFYKGYVPVNYRFVNDSDIVPHVPLEVSAWGLGVFFYKHIGTFQYLDRHGNLGDGMSDWEVKKAFMINDVASVAADWKACIDDHSLDRYINAIGRNLPGPAPVPQNVPASAKAGG